MTSTDKFVGYLVSVECKDIFYQGIVTQIDSIKSLIQLKNVFQNGIHCGSKLVDIKTTEIENIEILADPQNAANILKPKSIETEPSQKLSDETNLAPKSTSNNNNFVKHNNDNNNNNHSKKNHNNNSSNHFIKIPAQKHIKVSNSQHGSSHNNSHSNISPKSVSPPYYHNNEHSNKRSLTQKSYSQSHGNNLNVTKDNNRKYGSNNDLNTMNVDSVEEGGDDFDFETNLALFDKNKLYEELGQPILNTSTCTNPSEPQLNAYDSLIKQINSSKQSERNGGSNSASTQRYHQISVANLFSSTQSNTTPAMQAPPLPTNNGFLTPNTNGLLTNVTKTPNLSTSSSFNGSRNYRFDEMILGTGEPVNLQQIQVPCNLGKQYVTDDGFIIPCIDFDTHQQLFNNSYSFGFTKQRQIECMGRCCTEMAIQLIGGPLRFSKKNNHQKPTILILCNDDNLQGAYALCSARLLSIRSCIIHVFVSKSTNGNKKEELEYFNNELSLLQSEDLPENTFLNSIDDLRQLTSVDLIINSISDKNNPQSIDQLVKYIDLCKASVLSVDPVPEGSQIQSKWCILPVLPKAMSENCGRVYLCDLGFTKKMFNSVNIKYQSPFGAKFVIPLHND
jgi:hypothetical protein